MFPVPPSPADTAVTFTSSFWNVLTGAVCMGFIALLTYTRFSIPRNPERARKLDDPSKGLSPTIRSYTTRNRYSTYAVCYVVLWLAIYFALAKSGGLRSALAVHLTSGVDSILAFSALAICVLIPATPVLQRIEFLIRKILYDCARIPTAWTSLVLRIQRSPYVPPKYSRSNAEQFMAAVGFPTSRVDWTIAPREVETGVGDGGDGNARIALERDYGTFARVAMLDAQITSLRTIEDDEQIFGSLRTGDDHQVEADVVHQQYVEALTAIQPEMPKDSGGVAVLSPDARRRLEQIHTNQAKLLARWSLVKHPSDRERVEQLQSLGFEIQKEVEIPVPNLNDMLIFGLALTLVLFAPLAVFMPPVRAFVILVIVIWSSACPLYLGRAFPKLRARRIDGRFNACFTTLAALSAALVDLALSFLSRSIVDDHGALVVDFDRGWSELWTKSYPYALLAAYVAVACALFVQFHPADLGSPTRAQKSRFMTLMSVGSLLVTLVVTLTLWRIGALHVDSPGRIATRVVVPPLACFVVAFAFPHWYSEEVSRARVSARDDGIENDLVLRASR
jgi:hypothetical protein